MGNYYSDDVIEDIRVNNDIVNVVSDYVKIERKGKNYLGLCPFHREKTPSFSVEPTRQIFHCFGCGKGGNVIHFIMAIENIGFPDALKLLAERSGMTLPEADGEGELEKARLRKELLNVNKTAARFFYDSLNSENGQKAKKYLLERGLSENTLRRFGLGFSPDNGTALCRHMEASGISMDLLTGSGLAYAGHNGTMRDRFRGRIMFPIFDLRGNVTAFGGRIIEADKSVPKYVNSPENPVYSKSRNLYALNLAKNSGSKTLIIVEGYMDVISLHQNGIINAVASLGTSMTEGQARLLKKYAEEIVISFDSDAAGRSAAMRSLDLLNDMDCRVKILRIPEGKDPDDYVRNKGAPAFRKLVDSALPFIEHKIYVMKQEMDTDSTEGKIRFITKLTEMLARLKSPVETEMYIKKVSREYGISEESILAEMARRTATATNKKAGEARHAADAQVLAKSQAKVSDKLLQYEMSLLSVLCADNTAYGAVKGKIMPAEFTDGSNRKIAEIIFARLDNNIGIVPAEFFSMLDPETAGEYAAIIERECVFDDFGKAAVDFTIKIKNEHIEKRHNELLSILSGKEKLTPEDQKRLLSELNGILHQKHAK